MVERYVFVKLEPAHSTGDGRAELAAKTRELLPRVPGVAGVTVGVPADASTGGAWDLSIVVRFESMADVEPYRMHPSHRAYVDELLAPRMAAIKAWNFEVG